MPLQQYDSRTSFLQAGTVFTIRSVDDLISNIADLECIYNAGEAPNRVPLGPFYGTVLKFLSTDTFAPIIAPLWRGKLGSEMRCPATINWAMNVVKDRLRIAALLFIGRVQVWILPCATDEYLMRH